MLWGSQLQRGVQLPPGGPQGRLTERSNDGAGDAVGHHHTEDIHHPRVLAPELEVHGLVLGQKAGPAWLGCFCSSSSGKAASPLSLVLEEHLTPSAHQASQPQVTPHF